MISLTERQRREGIAICDRILATCERLAAINADIERNRYVFLALQAAWAGIDPHF